MNDTTEFEIIKRTINPSPDNWRRTTYRRKDGSTFLVSVPPRRSTTGVVDWNEDAEARMRDSIGQRRASDVKLLTVEDVEEEMMGDYTRSAAATIRALAERLARVEVCPTCPDSRVEAARLGYMAGHDDTVESRYGDPLEVAQDICQDLDDVEPTCPNCDDTRKAFKDWQAALRALGEGVCGLCGSDDDGCYCRYEAEPDTGEE